MSTTALALALILSAADDAVVSESRPAMGTRATVTIPGVGPEAAAPGIEAAFAVVARVDWSMNEWRPDGDGDRGEEGRCEQLPCGPGRGSLHGVRVRAAFGASGWNCLPATTSAPRRA
jgi:hypothetical protein